MGGRKQNGRRGRPGKPAWACGNRHIRTRKKPRASSVGAFEVGEKSVPRHHGTAKWWLGRTVTRSTSRRMRSVTTKVLAGTELLLTESEPCNSKHGHDGKLAGPECGVGCTQNAIVQGANINYVLYANLICRGRVGARSAWPRADNTRSSFATMMKGAFGLCARSYLKRTDSVRFVPVAATYRDGSVSPRRCYGAAKPMTRAAG
jgi:hypothetical protein